MQSQCNHAKSRMLRFDPNKYPCVATRTEPHVISLVNYLCDRANHSDDKILSRSGHRFMGELGVSRLYGDRFSEFVVVIGNDQVESLQLTSPLPASESNKWMTKRHIPKFSALTLLIKELASPYKPLPNGFNMASVSLVVKHKKWLQLFPVANNENYIPVLFINCNPSDIAELYASVQQTHDGVSPRPGLLSSSEEESYIAEKVPVDTSSSALTRNGSELFGEASKSLSVLANSDLLKDTSVSTSVGTSVEVPMMPLPAVCRSDYAVGLPAPACPRPILKHFPHMAPAHTRGRALRMLQPAYYKNYLN